MSDEQTTKTNFESQWIYQVSTQLQIKERIDYYFDSSEMMNYFILYQTYYN